MRTKATGLHMQVKTKLTDNDAACKISHPFLLLSRNCVGVVAEMVLSYMSIESLYARRNYT